MVEALNTSARNSRFHDSLIFVRLIRLRSTFQKRAADRRQMQSPVLAGLRVLQQLRVTTPVDPISDRVDEERASRRRIEEQPGSILQLLAA